MIRGPIFALGGAISAIAALGAFEPRAAAQGQGSFQPPIYSTDNDTHYASGTAVLVLANPLTMAGVVAFTGFGLDEGPHPMFGAEMTVSAFYGKGSLETGLAGPLGGPSLDLSIMAFMFNPIFKFKPIDEHKNGYVGTTIYLGPQFGSTTIGTENELGSVLSSSFLMGGSGGGVITIRLGGYVSLLGFGGAQYLHYFGKEAQKGIVVPTYGGTIKVHLTNTVTIDLGSTLSQVKKRESDDKDRVKIFMFGLTWNNRDGADVKQEGIW